jgi:GT2 family glycosyltransferase
VPRGLLLSNKQNVGFGRANNQLLAHLNGKYALLLNTDAFVAGTPCTRPSSTWTRTRNAGCWACAWRGATATCNPVVATSRPLERVRGTHRAGRFFPGLKMVDEMNWDHGSVRECDWLPGCFYLVRREVLDQVGLFDPRYFLYYEEVDHCKRVKRPAGRWCSTPYHGGAHRRRKLQVGR